MTRHPVWIALLGAALVLFFACGKSDSGSDDDDGQDQNEPEYFLIDEFLTWEAGLAACQADGGDLVSISSEEENDAAIAVCDTCTAGAACGALCWIGANDRTTEGTLEWSDGTAVSFTSFVVPDDNEDADDCVSMSGTRSFRDAGLWEYERCADGAATTRVSVCER